MTKPTFNTGDVPSASQVNDWFVNVLFARKTSDEGVTSSTTLQNDDDLFVTVSAGAVYELSMILRYDGANGDLTWQLVGPSGTTMHYAVHRLGITAVGQGDDGVYYGNGGENTGALGVGTDTATQVTGIVIVGGTTGTFRLQWAQNSTSVNTTRIRAGSHLSLRRVE